MTKTKIADGIFLLRFDTQYTLASSFLRIQEHHESNRFRNRVFTLEEYMVACLRRRCLAIAVLCVRGV